VYECIIHSANRAGSSGILEPATSTTPSL
jgi:hypothetical protein